MRACRCGRGVVSAHDGKCGHCRTKSDRAALDERFAKASARDKAAETFQAILDREIARLRTQ